MKLLSIDPGTKNMGYCVVSGDGAIEAWDVAAVPKDAVQLAARLDELFGPLDFDAVVIEKQLPRNPSMQRLQCWMEMYFAMRRAMPVCILHARAKLTYAATLPEWTPALEACPGAWTYAKRKKLAVHVVGALCEADTVFTASKKKDDLADCFLQARAFMAAGPAAAPPPPARTKLPRACAPRTARSRYTASTVVHFLKDCAGTEEIERAVHGNLRLRNALGKFYGTAQAFIDLKR